MSYLTGATNAQSLNGILTLTDGVITISEGTISGLEEIDLNDLQVADTATIENLVVNNQIDMTNGQIKNVATPTANGDATNKQFVDLNFLSKTDNTKQAVAGKIEFVGTNYSTGIALPVLDLVTSTSGTSNGAFIRTYKNLNRVANLEIGGFSYISEVPTNNVRREVDLIFRTNANTLAEMVINLNNATKTPLLINEDKYEMKNNNYNILKEDGTQLLYYNSLNDFWSMGKSLNMVQNNITNANTLSANFNLIVAAATSNYGNPAIQFTNTTTGSNNGIYMRFYKSFNRLPNTELGGIIFADRNAQSQVTSRAVQLKASIGNDSTPIFDILFNSGGFNPLRLSDTQNILSNDDFYIKNKTGGQNLLYYTTSNDFWTMGKDLNMSANNITNCNDITSTGSQFFGTNSTNNLDVKSSAFFEADVLIETNKHLAFYNSDLSTESGMRMYFDRSLGSLGRFLFDMRGSEIQFRTDPSSTPTSERVKINNNETTINNNLICNGNVNLGNNTTNDTTTINSVATFNGKTSFNDDVLIETNNHLAFNSGTLSTTNGMLMNYDGGVGYLDVRGSEFRIRTASSGTPSDIRFKVNDTNTSVINNFFVDGNTTLGNNVSVDTTTFNSKANFPSGSELKFNNGSTLLLQSGATTTFSSGSNTNIEGGANLQFKSNSSSYYLAGAYLEYANVQSFLTGSYIDSARVRIKPSGNSSFQLSNTNVENGVYCNNTNPITITMPTKNAYWNNRHYFIKVLSKNVDIAVPTGAGVQIDDSTNTINIGGSYRSFQFAFTSDFEFNGKIYIIGDK